MTTAGSRAANLTSTTWPGGTGAPGVWLGLAYLTMLDGVQLGCFFDIAKT